MRVLHIGKFYPPYPGGIERSTADLCAALTEHGIAVAVLAHAEPGTRCTQHYHQNDVDITLAACHGQLLYAPISPGFPWQLQQLIRRFRPDLLHLHMPNTSALSVLLLPAARRLPWIVHWHADVPLDISRHGLRLAYRIYRPLEQALLRRARAIIATSAPYRDASAALAPWRTKIHVIPLGLAPLDDDNCVARISATRKTNATNTESIIWPGPGLRILAVGRLSHYKGFDMLLRALAHVPDASLLLIGAGECETMLRNLAETLGVTARVRFAGRVDDATLAAAYAGANVFCLPSIERTEAFGLVLLEAMRARLPVVASAIPGSGVSFVVEDGITGLLVPPGNVDALTTALMRLAADPALRDRFGAAGQKRWQTQFTLIVAVEQMLELYRSVDANAHRAATIPGTSPPPA